MNYQIDKTSYVGSPKVVSALMEFHNYIKPSSQKENGVRANVHDELLTNLIKTMREDLYAKKRVNLDYPIIHLTGNAAYKQL